MAGQPFGCRVNDWSRLVWRFPGFSTERLAFRGPPPFLANWHGWSLNLWDLISGCISTLTLFHLLLYSVLHPYQITCPTDWPFSLSPPRLCPCFPLPAVRWSELPLCCHPLHGTFPLRPCEHSRTTDYLDLQDLCGFLSLLIYHLENKQEKENC